MVTAFSLLLQNFGVNGFSEAVIQKNDLNHKMMSTLFWLNAAISFSIMPFVYVTSPVVAWFYNDPRLTPITVIIALSIFASGLTTLHIAILRRNMQFYFASGISVIASAVSVFPAIIFAWQDGVTGHWWPTLVATISAAICAWIIAIGGQAHQTQLKILSRF